MSGCTLKCVHIGVFTRWSWVALKQHNCFMCILLCFDPTDGRKADTVDILKIHLVFNGFLLHFTQFDGIVLGDHVNNNGLLAWGECWHLPHSCDSVAILQKENMQLQKYTWSTRPTESDRLSPNLPSQYSTIFARWYTETPVYMCSDTVNAYIMTKKAITSFLLWIFKLWLMQWICWRRVALFVLLSSLQFHQQCNGLSQ